MPSSDETTDSASGSSTGGPIQFPSTHWDSILAAKDGDWPAVQNALGKLCARYRPAILSYFRIKWRSFQPWAHVQDAEDLTQSFIAHLLEANRLQELDPRKVSRFRHYLIRALRNFLQDWIAAQHARKRGEGRHSSKCYESLHGMSFVMLSLDDGNTPSITRKPQPGTARPGQDPPGWFADVEAIAVFLGALRLAHRAKFRYFLPQALLQHPTIGGQVNLISRPPDN